MPFPILSLLAAEYAGSTYPCSLQHDKHNQCNEGPSRPPSTPPPRSADPLHESIPSRHGPESPASRYVLTLISVSSFHQGRHTNLAIEEFVKKCFDRAYFIGVRGESRAFLYLYATDVTRYHQHDLINIAGVVDDALDVVLPTVATIRNSQ
ncbi:hypothetical protein BSL78_23592 [Apostichopus japonicus]|uniref:Uncharacterized protein n=1 Tax=Stichopus japonicus TaxID=307972 RepID=A0A2G8JV28_STIJA|nr:hypothetical protein BSL78_23592 [Apostichopus japonicus]